MSTYQKLSIHEKRAYDLRSVRESAVTCPICDMQVMPVDLLNHLELRCTGPREPGPSAKWATHREAVAMGTTKWTLSRWVDRGDVRVKGSRGDRFYLVRDLVLRIARRRSIRRR